MASMMVPWGNRIPMSRPAIMRAYRPTRKLCLCGCGERVRKTFTSWRPGHNSSANRKSDPNKLCACGCGQQVKRPYSTWLFGHQPKPEKKPCPACLCGCGQITTKPFYKWKPGHNAAAGQPRTYTKKSRAAFRESGRRQAAANKANGFHPSQRMIGCKQTDEHRAKNRAGVKKAIAEGRLDPSANSSLGWNELH